MRELWSYAHVHRGALAAGLVLSLLASLAAVAQPLAAQSVIDALSDGSTLDGPLILLTILVAVSAVAAGSSALVLDRTGERVVLAIRRRLSFRLARLRVLHSYRAGVTNAGHSAAVVGVSELALQASFLVVLGLGGALVAGGSLPVSTLIAFLLALFYLSAPIMSLTEGMTELQDGLGAVARLREVSRLETEDDVDHPPSADPPGRAVGGATIAIRGVGFSYPERSPALHDLTLTIPANRVTALVGPSGSGKSTCLALLLRFHEPDHGDILLDGCDIAAMPRAELRSRIAWVDQESSTVSGTLAENLRFGAVHATDEELHAALRTVRLDHLPASLPDGLDSDLREQGRLISGGERQRLSLARALLRRPAVLLLDEATSQVDTTSERALWDAILAVSAHTTVVMIAHRMTTIAAAHTIAVLEDGRLDHVGGHDHLVEHSATYRDLVSTPSVPTTGVAAAGTRVRAAR